MYQILVDTVETDRILVKSLKQTENRPLRSKRIEFWSVVETNQILANAVKIYRNLFETYDFILFYPIRSKHNQHNGREDRKKIKLWLKRSKLIEFCPKKRILSSKKSYFPRAKKHIEFWPFSSKHVDFVSNWWKKNIKFWTICSKQVKVLQML